MASGSWRRVESEIPEQGLFAGLSDLTATLFPTGRILVVGGTSNGTEANFNDNASVMTHYAGSLTSTVPAATVARSRQSIVLPDGRALITGGIDAGGQAIAAADLYDFRSQTWKSAAPLTAARQDPVLVVLTDGRVMAIGGYGGAFGQQATAYCDMYDPVADTWSAASPMQTPRRQPGVALLEDGKVLVAGGKPVTGGLGANALSSVEVYDPQTNSWGSLPAMPVALARARPLRHATTPSPSWVRVRARVALCAIRERPVFGARFRRLDLPAGWTRSCNWPMDMFSARRGDHLGVFISITGKSGGPLPTARRFAVIHALPLHDGTALSSNQQSTGGATEFTDTYEPLAKRWFNRVASPHLHSSAAVLCRTGRRCCSAPRLRAIRPPILTIFLMRDSGTNRTGSRESRPRGSRRKGSWY